MVSTAIKNWDNQYWLASKKYISSINKFLIKFNKLNKNSRILDIGCGRGKIVGSLSSKLKLKNKPVGIDLVNHKDKDKRVNFKKIDALSFFHTNKRKFDLILIKQTIHLLPFNQLKILLAELNKNLSPQGKIFIFMINPIKNEFPQFALMKKKFSTSLKYQMKISKLIYKKYPQRILKNFSYSVKISKKDYIKMVSNRFMSLLINLSKNQILSGINEINSKYKKELRFNDKLICIIIKKN
tara:strand:+ start:2273 stop:2992 length:720 start_codon:yes stop_codon:yes gene_type:complete